MAETTKTTATKEAREDIFIPRGANNEDPNYFVGINGKNYLLPRGKTSNVPSYVADEIRRSFKAQERSMEKSDELLDRGKEPIYKI